MYHYGSSLTISIFLQITHAKLMQIKQSYVDDKQYSAVKVRHDCMNLYISIKIMVSKEDTKASHPTLIVLGSGGHTAEMCQIIKALLQSSKVDVVQYEPRYYLVASTDNTSRRKIIDTMSELGGNISTESFIDVPRSRQVGQSWLTTIFTTLWALLFSFWLIWRYRPKLVLCNGPGTCVPFCYAAYLWRLLRRLPPNAKILFVESFCRVQTMSLSGKLLKPIVDLLVVQWPALAEQHSKAKNVRYFGRLM